MMNSVRLLRIIQQINSWGMFPALGLLFYLNQWHYYLLAAIGVFLISKIGGSIGQHRYFTHKSFVTTPWKNKLILWLATLSTTGTTLQYVTVHRHHHRYSDTAEDLHSPRNISWWRTWFHWYDRDPSSVVGLSFIRDMLKDPEIMWHHTYYFAIIGGYVLSLLIIDPWLVLFCYIIPAGYAWFNAGVTSLILHHPKVGYTNFDPMDDTRNSTFWNYITLGEGLHHNHHHHPQKYRFSMRPGEFDFSAWIIEKLLIARA